MTSSRLKRNAPLLKYLARAKPKVAKAIIKVADRDLIQTLCECSLNILKGHVRLNSQQKRKLRAHKHALRALAAKKTSHKRRQRLLQKGGLLPALLAPALGFFAKLFLQ